VEDWGAMSLNAKYDRLAEGFSEREYLDPDRYSARRAAVIVELGPRLLAGQTVLDLGCGDGIAAGPLLAYGLLYSGVDSSEQMVEAARRRFPELGFDVGTIEGYEPPEPVDATICLRAFHYAEDRLGFFRRVASYTRVKLVFDFRPADPADEIVRDLRAAGFSRVELRPFFLSARRSVPEAALPLLGAVERSGPLAERLARRFGRTFCSAAV
jgi:SAM-dependent methyltransferase